MIGYMVEDDWIIQIDIIEIYNSEKNKKYIDEDHIIHGCTKFKILSIKNIFTRKIIDKIIYNTEFINYRLSETEIQQNNFIEINDIIYKKPNDYDDDECEIFFLNENDAINFSFSFNRLVEKHKEYNINFSGMYRKYDQRTGKIKKEFYHTDGVLEGEYMDYYADGTIKTQCYYINGQIHGKHKHVYRDENEDDIIITTHYTLGIKNGECIREEYYDDANTKTLLRKEISNYINNIIVNPIIKYYYNGDKITSTKYTINKDGEDYFSFKINHEKDENNKLFDEMKIILDKLK
jgi:antitoxin component YwqK of YwqJK toxin-antitoxin module